MAWRQWTRDDDKRLEGALMRFPENSPNRFQTIADHLQLPLVEVVYYYDALVHDIDFIESGRVAVPDYPDYSGGISSQSSKNVEKDRKRGIPWSGTRKISKGIRRVWERRLEEHIEGDWKSISKEYVRSRTATQVASHAQKYYLRQNLESKAKKRSSIHDITSVDANNETVIGSDLDSMMGQPHFGQQMPPEHFHSHGYFSGSC